MHLPEHFWKQLFKKLKILLLILAVYYGMTWFTGCPIRFFTGISCPGCGMTRAWYFALHLDFSKAFSYHPLFFTAPLIVAGFLFDDWIDFKKYRLALFFIGFIFILTYLIRLLWFPNDIVAFQPENGFLFRMFKYFLTKISLLLSN